MTPVVTIERIAQDGAGETVYEGRTLRVFGMLPGERGVVEVKKRKGIFIGEIKELLDASLDRVSPVDPHYLSSSPWQCMTYSLQAALKERILAERFAYHLDAPKLEFIPANQPIGYRTKVEFSVTEEAGALVPAFHKRGTWRTLLPAPTGTILASKRMNDAAIRVISHLGNLGLRSRDIKAVVVRESKATESLLCIVYLNRERVECSARDIAEGFSGVMFIYSDPRSPASVATRVMDFWGKDHLVERVAGLEFAYPWDGFFQNNIPMFERALDDMRSELPYGSSILDLYAGVGTIGISLATGEAAVHCVESVRSSVAYVNENAKRSGKMFVVAEHLPAEQSLGETIARFSTLIVDPPRAGLHPKLLSSILQTPPERIFYLSCNPETQARDYSRMDPLYRIERFVGYDFYPQTPHMESLLLLRRRDMS